MTHPPTTVVIPAYNCSRFLRGAVESALAQSAPPAQILVVDDGSTDDTQMQAASLEALSPRVRYVRQENAGVSAARNTGVREASGEWIALLDADDRWHPRKLELQYEALAASPNCHWSLTGCVVVDDGDNELAGDPFLGTFSVFRTLGLSPDQYFNRWLQRGAAVDRGDRRIPVYTGDLFEALFLGNVCLPSSALVRRSAMIEMGGFNAGVRLAEETEFFHRLSAHFQVAYLAGPLVRYRKGGEGSLTAKSNTVPLAQNALRSMEAAAAYRGALTPGEQQTYLRGRVNLLFYLARAQLSDADTAGARETLRLLRSVGALRGRRGVSLRAAAMLPAAAIRVVQAARRKMR